MAPDSLQGGPYSRLGWALREGLIIAGILLVWLGVAVVLVGLISVLGTGLHLIGLRPIHHVAELLEQSRNLWPAFSSIALLTAGLYVVVRAGIMLIDHYRATASR